MKRVLCVVFGLSWAVLPPVRAAADSGFVSYTLENSGNGPADRTVRVVFSEALSNEGSSLEVVDQRMGQRVDRGDSRVDPDDPAALIVSFSSRGGFSVHWHTVSAIDGTEAAGSFSIQTAGGCVISPPLPPLPPRPTPTPEAGELPQGRLLAADGASVVILACAAPGETVPGDSFPPGV